MKVYELTHEDLVKSGYQGPKTHSGLRFPADKITPVKTIEEAEAIIVPLSTRETNELTPELWSKLVVDYKHIDQRRFVTFDCSDFEFSVHAPFNMGTFIRSNLKGWMKRQMPRSISWAWPVEDLKECMPLPEGGFKYHIGFHGWIKSSNVRLSSTQSCLQEWGNQFDYAGYNDFAGYLDRPVEQGGNPAEWARRRKLFKDSLQNCVLQLAPASIWHVFPYRFFEAMSAGRVPVLFCHDYCLPFADKIDWDRCTVRFTEQDAPNAGPLIRKWFNENSVAKAVEMGKYGREVWEKYLTRDKAPELMYMAVWEQFEKEGLLRG